jgi:nicotinamidase-related amidase
VVAWGGSFHPDFEPRPGEVVAQEHWLSSGFANTDLDLQLKKHGVRKVIVIGMRANTCIESTVRFATRLAINCRGEALVRIASAASHCLVFKKGGFYDPQSESGLARDGP